MIEKQVIESTYGHKATIKGYRESKTEYGSTKHDKVIVVEDILCALSQNSRNFNTTQNLSNDISYTAKLFCSPDIEVNTGDEIIVSIGFTTREFKAGEPYIYESHQEIPLLRESEA